MAARDVLKNINLFVDGRGYAGQVESVTPPTLTLQTEEFRAGGMDAPIDVTLGMEKLEASFALRAYDSDVLALFGLSEGASVPLTFRGALESYDGSVKAVVMNMRGKITSMEPGTWTPGELSSLKVTVSLNYFKQQHDGRAIHEIDVENMVRIINGVDTLAAIRSALAI